MEYRSEQPALFDIEMEPTQPLARKALGAAAIDYIHKTPEKEHMELSDEEKRAIEKRIDEEYSKRPRAEYKDLIDEFEAWWLRSDSTSESKPTTSTSGPIVSNPQPFAPEKTFTCGDCGQTLLRGQSCAHIAFSSRDRVHPVGSWGYDRIGQRPRKAS